jgi:uncharacterized protein with ATP-grasp and redox domains
MKAGPECLECLQKLVRQTTELATSDPALRARIEKEAMKVLERLSPDIVPPDLSNEFHPLIKELSGNPDPYRERKLQEMKVARLAFSKITLNGDLRRCVEIAALGNAIDFFVDPDTLNSELSGRPRFAIDDITKLENKLKDAKKIMYLADNAAEVFFDLPLVKALSRYAKVMYAVKSSPVQNDLTLEDLQRAGLGDSFDNVIKAPATVGIYLERSSPEFRAEFNSADLVVAKGMGNYETLSELPQLGRFFYIFRAKCGPVARSLGVEVGDYVAMLR